MSLREECIAITRYFTGTAADETTIGLYEKAHAHHSLLIDNRDSKFWHRCINNRLWMGWADAGLAIAGKNHVIRKKLLLTIAILESTPQHSDLFLPQKRGMGYLFNIFFTGLKGIFKMIAGFIVVKLYVRN